ncbi:MAG: ROK family transcriptional regulator [Burkholderiaceae bacterium]
MVDALHRGSNQSGLRAYNERLLLSLLREHGALPKTDLARRTGLSAQTISVIARELEGEGLLQRGSPTRGKVGQPSVPLSLAPEGAAFFGLQVGRRGADLVLIDFLGKLLARRHITYPYPMPEGLIRFVREGVRSLLADQPRLIEKRVAGLGIALPGQLWEWADKIGAPRARMDAWRTADIRALLAEELPFPVYLQNDASSACGAELVFGDSRGLHDFLYFYIDYFVGGGVVLGGSLYTGRHGNAGAVGSMPVPGPRGRFTQLIDRASLSTLAERLDPAQALLLWEGHESWDIDARVLSAWLRESSRALAHAITAAISVIEFDAILIDGWLPRAVRSELVRKTRESLQECDLSGLEEPRLMEGTVGAQARALGAAALPLTRRFLVDRHGPGDNWPQPSESAAA